VSPVLTGLNPGIRIDNVGMRFESRAGAIDALIGVDIDIPLGQFLCIVGPSGCGKTSLLRILAGLASATEGTVAVLENAAFGLRARGVPAGQARAVASGYLNKLGLSRFATYYPRELSGGMRQRVNLARAFANDSSVLLMDEPLSALDQQTKLLVQRDLLALWEESHKTVVYITHSLDEAVILGDRVIIMTSRPGRVKAIVDIDLPRPRDVLEIANVSAFVEYRKRCWDALRDEVLAEASLEAETG